MATTLCTVYTFVLITIISLTQIGCAGTPSPGMDVSTQSTKQPQIIGFVNDVPITQFDIQNDLAERSGHQALADFVLDQQLESQIQELSIEVSQSDISNEELIFIESLQSGDSTKTRYQLLEALRVSSGLGHSRYARFLRRNAMLRKLTEPTSSPTQAEYELATKIVYGAKFSVRLFVSDDQQSAIQHHRSLGSVVGINRITAISQVCIAESIHPSAQRGGLIPDFNPLDPAYPDALTNAVVSTPIGDLSPIISTDAGYAFLLVESRVSATIPSAEQIQYVEHQFKRRKEQTQMRRLANELINTAHVVITDRSLNWSWTNRP